MAINDLGGGTGPEGDSWQPWLDKAADSGSDDVVQRPEDVTGVQYGAGEGADPALEGHAIGVGNSFFGDNEPDDGQDDAAGAEEEFPELEIVDPVDSAAGWWRGAAVGRRREQPAIEAPKAEAPASSDARTEPVNETTMSDADVRVQLEAARLEAARQARPASDLTGGAGNDSTAEVARPEQRQDALVGYQTQNQRTEAIRRWRDEAEQLGVPKDVVRILNDRINAKDTAPDEPNDGPPHSNPGDELTRAAQLAADPSAFTDPSDNARRDYGAIRKTYVGMQLGVRNGWDKVVNKTVDLAEWRDNKIDAVVTKAVDGVTVIDTGILNVADRVSNALWKSGSKRDKEIAATDSEDADSVRIGPLRTIGHKVSQAYIKGPGERYTKKRVAHYASKKNVRLENRNAIYLGWKRRERRAARLDWKKPAYETGGAKMKLPIVARMTRSDFILDGKHDPKRRDLQKELSEFKKSQKGITSRRPPKP